MATSLMVANNEHPRVIQHRLGHADPHISMSVYAHVSADLDYAAAERLNTGLRRSGAFIGSQAALR